jgi:hypothetical protein
MKTTELKVIHRLLLINIINDEGKKGASLSDLKSMLGILGKLELTEDEKTEIGLSVDNDQAKWDPTKDLGVSVELSDEQFDSLKKMVKKRSDDKTFNFQVLSPMLEIAEKLGVDV